ncbi:MAG: ABC transporter ATP-binding protein, partial [Burkholderiaceae bacterium]
MSHPAVHPSLVDLSPRARSEEAPALEVRDLVSGYGAMTVLRDLGLRVGANEIVGVLGANGMGKTTLMKTLAGLVAVRAGTLLARGHDLARLGTHERSRLGIAYVPQGRGILATLSVSENLRMAWHDGPEPEEAALARVLGLFPRLERLLDRPGGALSGGEQQLLALARALVPSPWLLLLDEPTEGIQPNIVHEIAQTLVTLREAEGLSILVVEQNLDFILDVADRVLLLEKGSITTELTAQQLRDPRSLSRLLGFGVGRSARRPVQSVAAGPGQDRGPMASAAPAQTPTANHPHSPEGRPMTLRRPNVDQLREIAAALHMHPT